MEYALKYDTKIAFGTECRKTVTRQMEFSSPHDIGNYVKRLKRKNVVFKDNTGDLRFNPLILGVLKSRKLDVQFTINNDSSEVL